MVSNKNSSSLRISSKSLLNVGNLNWYQIRPIPNTKKNVSTGFTPYVHHLKFLTFEHFWWSDIGHEMNKGCILKTKVFTLKYITKLEPRIRDSWITPQKYCLSGVNQKIQTTKKSVTSSNNCIKSWSAFMEKLNRKRPQNMKKQGSNIDITISIT